MSIIRSDSDHLTLNAQGSSKSIKFQSAGVEKASISSVGLFTSTTIDATKLTGILPAIDGSNLTGLVHTDSTKLSLAGGALTGAVTTNSTFDGVDIATRDGILTSTTTTANAALPKAGGTMTGTTAHGDSVKATYGASADLQIYHDGSHSYIKDTGTGNLYIKAAAQFNVQGSNNEPMIVASENGGVSLYYDNASKLATTSTGIDVTGNVVVSGTVDGVDIASRDSTLTSTTTTAGAALPKAGGTMTGSFTLNDNVKIQLGTSDDLQIYHDGSASYISDVGTGSLYLRGTNLVMDSSTGEKYIDCIANADVKLFYDNSSKLATTSSGIDVTGTVAATSFTGDGSALTGISAGPSHTSSGTAPSSPSVGDKWHDTTNEKLYMRTNDGTSDLWLQI